MPTPSDNVSSNIGGAFVGMSQLSDFTITKKLGEGTFGEVSKAVQKSSGRLVALKKLIIHNNKDGFPITAFREVTILKKLKHENILQLIDMVCVDSDSGNKNFAGSTFYTVSPYMSCDLSGLLENPRVKFTIPHIKCILRQMLQGIDYLHGMRYLHRDIKAANILVDQSGYVKIADFGLARIYHGPTPGHRKPGGGKVPYTGLVVTRWYRAPELLLGERLYTTSVDMWGVGCIFGELFKKKPILQGKSDMDQAFLTFDLCGSPTEKVWPGSDKLPRNGAIFKNRSGKLKSEFREVGPEGLRLLQGLLNLDPYQRVNAQDALHHEYFIKNPLPVERLPAFEDSHEQDVQQFKKEKSQSLGLTDPHAPNVYDPVPRGPRDRGQQQRGRENNNPNNIALNPHRNRMNFSRIPPPHRLNDGPSGRAVDETPYKKHKP